MFVVQKVYTAPSLFFLGNHALLSQNNQSSTRLKVKMTLMMVILMMMVILVSDDNNDVGESPIDLA